jgi:hypothetical protein
MTMSQSDSITGPKSHFIKREYLYDFNFFVFEFEMKKFIKFI